MEIIEVKTTAIYTVFESLFSSLIRVNLRNNVLKRTRNINCALLDFFSFDPALLAASLLMN